MAEGFERGTTNELITFVYIARGPAGEVRSMLHFVDRLPGLEGMRESTRSLRTKAEEISRQLAAWATSLQNSGFRGQRYSTHADREEQQRRERAEAFKAHLKQLIQRKVPDPGLE